MSLSNQSPSRNAGFKMQDLANYKIISNILQHVWMPTRQVFPIVANAP